MNNQQQHIFIHIIIALMCLPIHYYMGEMFKLALLPYIIFMLYSKNPNYLPALIIHTTPGNTVSLVVLFATIWLAMANFKKLKQTGVAPLLVCLLIVFPVFLYFLYEGIFIKNIGLSFSLQYLGFYLSFFPFFYGVLIADKITKAHWVSIVLVIFLMPIIMLLPLPERIVIRLFWLALPLSICLFVVSFFSNKLKVRGVDFKFWSILFILFIGIPYGLKFTPIFSALIAILILIFYVKGYKSLFNLLTSFRVGIVVLILIVLAINNIGGYSTYQQIDIANFEIVDFESFMTYLNFKTFDDRAVLWKGAWDFLINKSFYWPTGEVPSYSFQTSSGRDIEDIEFGAHNLGLELMRNYGIVFGVYLISIYLIIITKLNIVFSSTKNPFILILTATLMGLGIAEAIVGQAVLMPIFSFTFLGLVGSCYGIAKLKSL